MFGASVGFFVNFCGWNQQPASHRFQSCQIQDKLTDPIFLPLACAECNNSLLFSRASSIPLCFIPFPSTLFHQLVFQPPSLHLAIYFLVYLSALLFPNSYIILFWEFYFFSIFCTCQNQCDLFNITVSVIVGF